MVLFGFIFMTFCFNYSFGLQKQLCEDDLECLMNAIIDKVYPRFVVGMPGVETSDPLHLDAIVADLPTINYSLYDASLIGLKGCQFVKFNNTIFDEYTLFDYAIECPVLTMTSEYELNGIVDSEPVEGKGSCKIKYHDYYISTSGKHEKVLDEEGQLHIQIIDYAVKPILRGDVDQPEYGNLIFSNNDKCNNRVRLLEETTREVVMDAFMHKYIQNLMSFHKHVSIENMYYKYVS